MPLRIFQEKRDVILKKWIASAIGTYPLDTGNILSRKRDRITNPTGYAIEQGLVGALDQLLGDMESHALEAALDPVIRIRSIQDFSASQAVSFVFGLKPILRQLMEPGAADSAQASGLLEMEGRVDRLALIAFDLYVGCREKLFEVRVNELRRNAQAAARLRFLNDRELADFGGGDMDARVKAEKTKGEGEK